MNETTDSIFEGFNGKHVRLWVKNGKQYFGTLRTLKDGEVCTISRDGNPEEVHAVIRDISVLRIEILHNKRDNYAATKELGGEKKNEGN